MKSFSLITLLAFATAIVATPVPEAEAGAGSEAASPKPASTPVPGSFTMWKDKNFSGQKLHFTNLNSYVCANLNNDWNDKISSAGPTSNAVCTLWEDFDCKGRGYTVYHPGIADLSTVGFNDRASSVQCA